MGNSSVSASDSPFPLTQPDTERAIACSSQWQRLLKNSGVWRGSFTQLSGSGEILAHTPTEVALIPTDNGNAMHQEVRRFATQDYSDSPQVQSFDYRALNRATLFFADGAFSQGSLQWAPFAGFGAEFGFLAGQRRMRLVQQFAPSSATEPTTFRQLTLIREALPDADAPERPPLTIESLLGTWRGQAVTQYADLQPEEAYPTEMILEQTGDRTFRQTLSFPDGPPLSSSGQLTSPQSLNFTEGLQPVRVLLLPDGASATFPLAVTPRQPFFIEAGWLLNERTRQRMIRRYDNTGAWVSLILVTEHKA